MELIGSLFLILALALIVGMFIARPLISGFTAGAGDDASGGDASGGDKQAREHERSALMAERDRLLTALQDLDFDNALGKVPAEEYPRQRASLLKAGAETLRRLDELSATTGGAATSGAGAPSRASAEDRLEAAIAARRADSRGAGAAQVQTAAAVYADSNGSNARDELENLIASRKRERKESAGGFCPKCGKPVSKSDRFCSRCGAAL
jgi:hypothetical protein